MFQVLQRYVASVLYHCCRNRSGCCTCCNAYVSSVYSKCFVCITRMLQVFHLDTAKVDLDVAYTCMLQAYISNVSYVCCIRLQWLSSVFRCFASVLEVCCKCFNCFGCILQVFHLDVAKADLFLHMLQWDDPPDAKNRQRELHFSCACGSI